MNRRAAFVVGVLVLLLAGACSGDGDGGADDGAVPATTTTSQRVSTTSAPTGGSTTTTAATIAVVLGPGRLLVGGNALVVGAPRSQVEAYLERALGEPERVQDGDCESGRLTAIRWTGLTAYVSPDTGFAGWSAHGGTFATAKGVRIGETTAEQLRSAHPDVQVSETSLGTEAFVPDDADDDTVGMTAVLESDRVAALWSGEACVFR
jgi:hypothetical protein